MILSIIEHFSEGKQFFAKGLHNIAVIYATEVFCTTLTVVKLWQAYEKISKNKLECA